MASAINLQDSTSSSSSSLDSDNLSCPVCFDLLLTPIYQCNNGHLVCNVCIEKLTSCAVCRLVLPEHKIRNLIAEENVAKSSMKCPNRARGCRIIFKGDQRLKHLQDCEYRLIRVCPSLGFPGCVRDLPVKHIARHLKSVHNVKHVSVSILEGQYVTITQRGFQGEETRTFATERSPSPVLLLIENYPPLILKTTRVIDSLSWTISALHSHEKFEKVLAKIRLLIHPGEINSVAWKGKITKLKNENRFDREAFSVPIRKMRGLEDWKLLVKISSETNRNDLEGEIAQLNIEARPAASLFEQDHIPGSPRRLRRLQRRLRRLRPRPRLVPEIPT